MAAIVQENPRVSIPYESPVGEERLKTSDAKSNADKLIRAYERQIKPTYCSIATSVVALNALFFGGEKTVTQQDFYSRELASVSQNQVDKGGLPLNWLAQVLENLGKWHLTVSRNIASTLPNEQIHQSIRAALMDPNQCVLAQFCHPELGQKEGVGHWSPLAAYHEKSDSFLILDVNHGSRWVDASLLIEAMKTATPEKKSSRGFLILKK